MRYSLALIVVLLGGCASLPTDLIKSASEVQADNDKYWAEVAQRRAGMVDETEVVQTTGVILHEAVLVEPNTRTYKLEVYPLGP